MLFFTDLPFASLALTSDGPKLEFKRISAEPPWPLILTREGGRGTGTENTP